MWQAVRDASRSTCRFLKRHRRTIVIGGVTAAAVSIAYWRASEFLSEVRGMRDDLERRLWMKQRRARGVERASRECLTAVESFLPTLRARLGTLVDTNAAIKRLKELRNDPLYKNKRNALWEELKLNAFTRWAAMIYAASFLNLLLRMQVHVLGRQALLEEHKLGGKAAEMDRDQRHRLLSLTYEYLLGDGLQALVTACNDAVSKALGDWTVATQKKVPFEALQDVLESIRSAIEDPAAAEAPADAPGSAHRADDGAGGAFDARSPLLRYMIHPRSRTADAQSASVRRCLQETWDLAESPMFHLAMQETLDAVFGAAAARLRDAYFVADAAVRDASGGSGETPREPEQQAGGGTTGGDAGLVLLEPPLAHVITAIQKESAKMLEVMPSGEAAPDAMALIETVAGLESVEALCHAAFGLTDDEIRELTAVDVEQ